MAISDQDKIQWGRLEANQIFIQWQLGIMCTVMLAIFGVSCLLLEFFTVAGAILYFVA